MYRPMYVSHVSAMRFSLLHVQHDFLTVQPSDRPNTRPITRPFVLFPTVNLKEEAAALPPQVQRYALGVCAYALGVCECACVCGCRYVDGCMERAALARANLNLDVS